MQTGLLHCTIPIVPANDYRFVTEWTFEASVDRVFPWISRPLDYPRWWPEVFVTAKDITAGASDGVGQVLEVRTRLWLPSILRHQATIVEVAAPIRMSFETTGGFGGLGIWTLWDHGSTTMVRLNWKFRADSAAFRWFWWVLRPVFFASYRWAMARGEAALRRELAKR